jgi:pimeloyl-ACP methyl ester carboxylesterase
VLSPVACGNARESALHVSVKKKLKRWLVFLALAVVLGIVALNLLAYRHAYAMMHFTTGKPRTKEPEKLTLGEKAKVLLRGVRIPRPRTIASPIDLAPGTTSLLLKCTNGIKLGAWYCAGSTESPLVILFHGYSSEKSGTLPEAMAFLKLGLSVLLVDFRGSGDSSESYTTVGFDEAQDVAAATRYALAHLPHRRLVLYGQSMGAAAILRAVNSCGVQPDAIIVEAVFDKMLNTVRHRFEAMGVPSFPSAELLVFWGGHQAGFNGFAHNPLQYATSVTCPILFLHGTADPRAHIEEARRVFAAVSAPKRFKEFPAVGHEASVVRYPAEWNETVRQFLAEVEK